IDSPDNGPVLFESAFDNNEIALIDAISGKKVWSFPTGKEWVGGVALSDDGKYLAAQTSNHIYLFETSSAEPKWAYTATRGGSIGGDVKGGIDISADGSLIFALLGNQALLFGDDSNRPLWQAATGNGGYNAAISASGEYMAVATAGTEEDENTNLLIVWHKDSSERLWQYHSSGNFHDVSFSADGGLIAAATGCPDRRAYLFSKDSNNPLWRSEMLTRDSPIHRAAISADGSLAAFGVESSDGAVHLFSRDLGNIQWKFPAPGEGSFRAVRITPNGKFIGGATLSGGAYIFGKDSATPLATWEVGGALGTAAIAPDGSFLAVGGTDSQVHILERESQQERAAVRLGEFVGETDISADGRYIAAGTSGSVYFFEALSTVGSGTECTEIIEPPSEEEMIERIDPVRGGGQPQRSSKWPGMLFGFGFLGSLIILGSYAALVKFNLFNKADEERKFNKYIMIGVSVLAGLFLLLTTLSVLINSGILSGREGEQAESTGGEGAVCGNNLCEPNLGETKETCPQDCSAGD
ncbi:WD40 repeat domain-containing protein, partial [Candidatus Parcubacteria bacterium]|nr:WD40 repeat domain-containing protein [Candidatus Parcubacteria bacterium]